MSERQVRTKRTRPIECGNEALGKIGRRRLNLIYYIIPHLFRDIAPELRHHSLEMLRSIT
jgi:hypothetical protein